MNATIDEPRFDAPLFKDTGTFIGVPESVGRRLMPLLRESASSRIRASLAPIPMATHRLP